MISLSLASLVSQCSHPLCPGQGASFQEGFVIDAAGSPVLQTDQFRGLSRRWATPSLCRI